MAHKNHPKRHCMIVHASYPLGETRVEREAQALIRAGYDVDVICLWFMDEQLAEVVDKVNVYRMPVKRDKKREGLAKLLEYLSFFVLAFFKVALLYRQKRYGSVQVHNLPDFLIFSALIPKLFGSRLILDLHDLMPEFYASSSNRSLDSFPTRLVRWQEAISCWFADHVITVSESWRETLIQRGVPAAKISVVMNVADDQIFSAQARNGQKGRHENGGFRLIYHGTFAYRYGIDLAIRAVRLLKDEIPGIHLTLHGDGEFRLALQELVKELGLERQVQFSTLFIPTTELPKLLLEADVGVIPYRRNIFTDGILPTKLMEYSALGIPSVVARTPAIASYFDDDMVQFFEPESVEDLARCLLELHSHREKLSQLALNVQKFTKSYNWTFIASQYSALVDRLNGSLR